MATINRTITVGTHHFFTVEDFADNGTTLDTTEQLAIGGQTGAVATTVGRITGTNPDGSPIFVADPVGRVVKIAAIAAGGANVTVSAPGVPVANQLTIATTTVAPNNSRIDFVSELGPFPN